MKPSTKNHQPSTAVDGKAELVPAVPKKLQAELARLEEKVFKSGVSINRRLAELTYDIVEMGLYLLKIRALYALNNEDRARAGGRARSALSHCDKAKACLTETGSEPVGFSGWLTAREEYVPRGSAYRYMNAALNAGLTENSSDTAAEKLRESRSLEGKKLSDLYKTPKQLNAPQQNEQLEFDLVADTIKSSTDVCEQLVKLRDEMDEAQFRVVVERLEKTLEDLTGAEWEMVDTRKSKEVRQHGR